MRQDPLRDPQQRLGVYDEQGGAEHAASFLWGHMTNRYHPGFNSTAPPVSVRATVSVCVYVHRVGGGWDGTPNSRGD